MKMPGYNGIRPVKIGKITVIDRRKPADGKCELCGKYDEVRPYGPVGEWVCFDCGQKDKAMTERRMCQILFGEKPDA